MIIVRNTFKAKPGQAGNLVAKMKEMASAGDLRNCRFLTDLSGEFNTVVMEHEVESLSEFESNIDKYMNDPGIREKAAGYTDLWTSGKREFFRVA